MIMERKILFRAKSTHNGEWVEGSFIHAFQEEKRSAICGMYKDVYFIAEISGKMHTVDPETVCQYTGLADRNCRKIFEGDIVQYTDEVIGKEKVDEVKYNETHAAFCRLHKVKMGLQYLFIDEAIANRCEVIGNIFDNPELLKTDG